MQQPEKFREYVRERVDIKRNCGDVSGKFYFVAWEDYEGNIIGINEFPSILSFIETRKNPILSQLHKVVYNIKSFKIGFPSGDEIHFECEKFQKSKKGMPLY